MEKEELHGIGGDHMEEEGSYVVGRKWIRLLLLVRSFCKCEGENGLFSRQALGKVYLQQQRS